MRGFLVFALCVIGSKASAAPVNLDSEYKLRVGTETVAFVPNKPDDLRRLSSWVDKILEEPDDESKHSRRGLEEISRLAHNAVVAETADDRRDIELDLLETTLAVNNLLRPPIPRPISTRSCSPMFLRQLHRPLESALKAPNHGRKILLPVLPQT